MQVYMGLLRETAAKSDANVLDAEVRLTFLNSG